MQINFCLSLLNASQVESFLEIISVYLENLSSSEDTFNPVLVKIRDSFVHELEENLKILMMSSLQNHDELPIEGGVAEQLGEMSTACC